MDHSLDFKHNLSSSIYYKWLDFESKIANNNFGQIIYFVIFTVLVIDELSI